jgi:hypothetical protein
MQYDRLICGSLLLFITIFTIYAGNQQMDSGETCRSLDSFHNINSAILNMITPTPTDAGSG